MTKIRPAYSSFICDAGATGKPTSWQYRLFVGFRKTKQVRHSCHLLSKTSYLCLLYMVWNERFRKEEDGVTRVHQPHPNVVDELRGTIRQVEPTTPSTPVANGNSHNDVTADDNSDVEDDNIQSPVSMDNISEEFQLPKELLQQQQPNMQSAKKWCMIDELSNKPTSRSVFQH
jgi:hypothetical protein